MGLWQLCQSQRYGQGMTVGTLVHSEIWNNLREFEFENYRRSRAFLIIVGLDEIWREFALRAQERESKRSKASGDAKQFTQDMQARVDSGKTI